MKLGFVHIPKCAGTSVTKSLEIPWVTREDISSAEGHIGGHHSLKELRSQGCDTFATVLRDPWERFLSYYRFVTKYERPMPPFMSGWKDATIDEFYQGFRHNAMSDQLCCNTYKEVEESFEFIGIMPEIYPLLVSLKEWLGKTDTGTITNLALNVSDSMDIFKSNNHEALMKSSFNKQNKVDIRIWESK